MANEAREEQGKGRMRAAMIDRAVLALPGAKGMLALLAASSAVRAAATVGQAFALATALVNLWYGEPVAAQAGWIAGFFACFTARQAVTWFEDTQLERYACARADELREAVLSAVFTLGGRIVQRAGTGAVATTVLEGVEEVESYLRLILPKMVRVVVVPLLILACVFPLDWVSGLIMLVMFPTIVFYMALLGSTAKAAAERKHDEFEVLSNHFVDSLRGIDTLKLFGRSASYANRVFEVSERFRRATMATLRIAILSGAVLDLASTLSLAAVAIMLGFRMVEGAVAFFPALFVLILVPEYFKPIREFSSDFHASLDGKNALSAINELVGKAQAEAAAGVGTRVDAGASPIAPWGARSRFELRDVGFSYPEHEALSHVSFAAEGCVRVGIVGASGSGKSTLANLIGGFEVPSAGCAVIDGCRLPDLRADAWQSQLAYVPQSPYVFHATLRENLAFYRPGASDAEVAHAVQVVGLEELVAELPRGLDTVVGEGARPLSGGEAQRVALARIVLDRTRRVLVFDEPTAHLDIETELELKERMLPLFEGRLVFFATHRLHWLADMDMVAVLDGGRVVEFGAPDELLRAGGALARLAAQMGEGGAR